MYSYGIELPTEAKCSTILTASTKSDTSSENVVGLRLDPCHNPVLSSQSQKSKATLFLVTSSWSNLIL